MAERNAGIMDYDVVIVGSGSGGGTMARALAGQDASVLLLERGDWLPREWQNWDPASVWQDKRYRTTERWLNKDGEEFTPFMHYVVGGNTKFWGAALFRLRRTDFDPVEHRDGVSPGWPITYDDLVPWYDLAERMYEVHGEVGEDPTEPERKPFPFPPVQHDPAFELVVEQLRAQGLHPSYLPLGLRFRPEGEGVGCVRCSTCNSFPCLTDGKSDADVCAVAPAVRSDNVTLWTEAHVERLVTDPSGTRVTEVVVRRRGEEVRIRGRVVVLSAGAVNSTAVLLRSATERHPDGLANSSGLVGRNYMAHLATMMEAFHPFKVNPTSFQKTVAINDFYTATERHPYPLGQLQSQGRAHAPIVKAANRFVPLWAARAFVRRGVDWLAMTEDLPVRDNRVTLAPDGRIRLSYHANNRRSHHELVGEAVKALKAIGYPLVVRHEFKNENTTHQCGTMVFGDDPRRSVLDTMCRTHDVDNLYVVDASFFPSSAAVNPGLTVIAQSLRVADHILRTELRSPR